MGIPVLYHWYKICLWLGDFGGEVHWGISKYIKVVHNRWAVGPIQGGDSKTDSYMVTHDF